MTKNTKLVAMLFVLTALALSLHRSDWTAEAQEPSNKLEIIGVSVPFAERLSTDDGALLAVHFGGDIHGSLDTCG